MDKLSTVRLRSDNKMPVIGLGTWRLTKDTANTVAKALELGYHMIDTSGDYGTQPGIAEGIKRSGVSREDFYIVTKVEETEDSFISAQNNLRQLELDYANLILIHRPPEKGAGVDLWKGLMRARREGFVIDIGVSNYTENQIEELIEATGEIPVVNQIEWSPFGYSEDMLNYCRENSIVIQAYSPLTRGERLENETLLEIADSYGKTPAQLLIGWNLRLGAVPIVKANREEHLKENLDVFDFEISDDDMATLNELNEQYSALGQQPAYMGN